MYVYTCLECYCNVQETMELYTSGWEPKRGLVEHLGSMDVERPRYVCVIYDFRFDMGKTAASRTSIFF